MNIAFLEIGGNQGDRFYNINRAMQLISEQVGDITAESNTYETEPWGFVSSNNFYNKVIKVETTFSAIELLKKCNNIENELGRVRGEKQYMSRTMDIDILFYNDEIIKTDILQLPHSRLHLRKFVLMPLSEIASDFSHPIFKQNIKDLLLLCKDDSKCIKL